MFEKQIISLINFLPFFKTKLKQIELTAKEFRFVGNNLEYFPLETLVGSEDLGFNIVTASYYPREYLNDEWIKFIILKWKGILIRQHKNGYWQYIKNEMVEYKKINFDLMITEMKECINKMPSMFNANEINKHNFGGFQKYIIKTPPPEKVIWVLPINTVFDAAQINGYTICGGWYIGDESRPTIGNNGDYLVVYNGNSYKFTQQEVDEMKWELVE